MIRHLQRAVLLTAAVSGTAWAAPSEVELENGRIRGEVEGGVAVYRAVPYAAAPVGSLRWKPPQPVVPWQGVRDATKNGPVCPQPEDKYGIFAPGTTQSEDCLTLNVFAPADAKNAPVMVWLHGGGHQIGSGSQIGYDGSQFAKSGVILVSVNYRLGMLGYFAHPGLTAEAGPDEPLGSYGDMDAQAALKWVQANIARLGGDPSNVTLFGESAGGDTALNLLANPEHSRGLVHKVISQSGGGWNPVYTLAQKEAEGVKLAQRAGAPAGATAAELRALPAGELALINGDYRPFADGRFYKAYPAEAFSKHEQLKVPLVIGSNTDEGALLMMVLGASPEELSEMTGSEEALRTAYGIDDDKLLTRLAVGDVMMVAPARFIARKASDSGSPVWLYNFDYVPTALAAASPLGAGHGQEVPFVFGNAAQALRSVTITGSSGSAHTATATDLAVAKHMNDCWTAFARTGVPCEGVVNWPQYDTGDKSMKFGAEPVVEFRYRKAPLDFHEQRHALGPADR